MNRRPPPFGIAPALGLAALSGAICALALPPLDLWPLAFVSWAPLFIALHGRSPRQALLLGAAQGLVSNIGACTWLPAIVKSFGGLPSAACVAIALLICLYSGGRSAALAWLAARAERRGWSRALSLVLAFGATEALYPLLFPWYTATEVHRVPLFMQLAELGGPALVGIPLLLSGFALAEVACARLDARAVDGRRVGIALLGPAAMLAFGAARIFAVDRAVAAATALTVGIVQGNVPHTGASLTTAMAIHRDATVRLQTAAKLDLVVWPETALGEVILSDQVEPTMKDMADPGHGRPRLTPAILTGSLVRRGDDTTNSAILFAGDSVRGVYDKMHPLAFGEYIPFGDVFPSLYRLVPNAGHLTRGTDARALPLGEHRISTLICYEDILAAEANRAVSEADPDLLVNLTNDSWFGDSPAAAIHLALAKLRAVEHRRYLVHATNSGVSAFVDPVGRASGETGMLEEQTRVGVLRWMRARTVYEQTGDAPWWLAGIAVAAMGVFSRRRTPGGMVAPGAASGFELAKAFLAALR